VSSRPAPPDQDARDRIVNELGSTLFVEAGAGSGKTSALVDRVLALIDSGAVELGAVAAITFTEKAGDELRGRIRQALERAIDDPGECGVADPVMGDPGDAGDRARYRLALEQLDGAAIGTLHSFARRILSENAVEARLPPRIEVLDEVSSAVAFEQRWARFLDQLLADPDLERVLLLLFVRLSTSQRIEALRRLALVFEDNWDLVESQVDATAAGPPDIRRLFATAARAARRVYAEPCLDPQDKLALRMADMTARLDELALIDDEVDLLEALGDLSLFAPKNYGRRASFACDVTELKTRVSDARDRLAAVRDEVAQACVRRVAAAIRGFTLAAAEERRRAGQLQFHDLLVLARALLRDPVHGPAVRDRLQDRYRRLLLDEFQDTDPIQVELAVRIAAADPTSPGAGDRPWSKVGVTPGRLFFVGDPKQSIYRFRRADIATFLAAAARFGDGGRGLVELTANFRTTAPVIDWINETFGRLMALTADPDLPVASQAAYIGLDPTRPAAPVGPSVAVMGREEHPRAARADELRGAEAAEVSATVARIVAEGWEVDDGAGGWRPARLGDITILVPARTSLPFLEDALDRAGVPFRAEASSLVYASRAARDVLMVLRAVDDPTNGLHLISALRTPLLACGDDDLFRFKAERRGRLHILAEQPDTVPADDTVRAALGFLRSLHDDRHWVGPAELLDRIATGRRAFELGFGMGRPRDVWRRLRFVADQARAWSDATGGNLRQYLAWVGGQAAEGARVADAVLPETDDDAVRIMTIHSAKGLEFPITIVSGMSTLPQRRRAGVQVVFRPDGGVGYKLGKDVTTAEYRDWEPVDEQMELDERVRLLYVASTRARDHLVISLHHKSRAGEPAPAKLTNAELLIAGMDDRLGELPDAAGDLDRVPAISFEPPTPPPPFADWEARREDALTRASRPSTVAATALTEEGMADPGTEPGSDAEAALDEEVGAGLQKRPRDLDLPPWLKGRYGTAVGRAVHGVLQTVDLATGAGLDAAVAAQCEAEAVTDRAGEVRELSFAALNTSAVMEAAASAHWREIYVCVPVGERLVEGYVDLLYRGADGLVVVDYKTAATDDPAELDRRVEGYRNQGAAYALAVAEATGEPVTRVVFCFLTPAGAVERVLPDLEDSVVGVRGLIAGGREIVTA
jgi:ATP-dependent exoDNAse (exonuclease V) beta subunit